MFWERIRATTGLASSALEQSDVVAAPFVPFYLAAIFTPDHQAQIIEVYRVAAERTRAQIACAPQRRFRLPLFSVN
jgi:hypothetical protein